MEDLGPETLFSTLRLTAPGEQHRHLLKAAGRLTAWLHRARVQHGDLKPSNFARGEHPQWPSMELQLLDLDKMRFGVQMTATARLVNLRQFLDALPPEVEAADKHAFVDGYIQTDIAAEVISDQLFGRLRAEGLL
jgi:tRNA A-37 threonylcarbamoyl transferase component Bud32